MNDIYDQIFAIIAATFPTKTLLNNPYEIADNNDLFLKNGYGVELGGVALSDTFSRELRQFERVVSISFTNLVVSSDQKSEQRILDEKQLMTDEIDLIVALKDNLKCDFCEFTGDDGIEFVKNEQSDVIRLRMSFVINYNQKVR